MWAEIIYNAVRESILQRFRFHARLRFRYIGILSNKKTLVVMSQLGILIPPNLKLTERQK